MTRLDEVASDYRWLIYFWDNADFGPAHEDVIAMMMQAFEKKTGRRVPEEFREGYLSD